ncbi:hypothetical protein R6Q59_010485 [Mikania micrantha]
MEVRIQDAKDMRLSLHMRWNNKVSYLQRASGQIDKEDVVVIFYSVSSSFSSSFRVMIGINGMRHMSSCMGSRVFEAFPVV